MKKRKLILSSLLVALLSTGCVVSSPALYSKNKDVETVHNIVKLPMLKHIPDERTHFNILYKAKHTKPSIDDYVNTRGSNIDLNKLPTVVIALPVETRKTENDTNELDKTDEFKTEGYISKSEETVEKELIRAGFGVIDRSKFEAKLRTLRDSKNLDKDKETIGTAMFEARMKVLEKQLENKKISVEEYSKKLASLDEASNSRYRGDKELIDMSELIRAAQSKGVQADYILQLNKIEEYNGYITQLSLKGNSKIEEYISKNTNLRYGYKKNDIPLNFDVRVFRVVFSAKLFNVQSGKVVWSGSHELNSLDIEDTTVDFDIMKQDITSKGINLEQSKINAQLYSLHQEALNASTQLKKLYNKASQEREYKDKNIQMFSEQQLRNSISKNLNIIVQNNKEIDRINAFARDNKISIKFDYKVSDLIINPNLNTLEDIKDPRKQRVIKNHRSKLLSETIRTLLNTIKVKNR